MIKNVFITVLMVGFILQLLLINAVSKTYKQLDVANQRLYVGLLACMQSCQAGGKNE
jgi:hypothetical protein